ncbi:hypothetical protein DTW90_30445 [Neorhizobium sp. P12A]|nr:hypothetical protein DTW90_30445 [Neorhizobium sp. P12A]
MFWRNFAAEVGLRVGDDTVPKEPLIRLLAPSPQGEKTDAAPPPLLRDVQVGRSVAAQLFSPWGECRSDSEAMRGSHATHR